MTTLLAKAYSKASELSEMDQDFLAELIFEKLANIQFHETLNLVPDTEPEELDRI